jgi:predicted transcriptional regulator
MLTKLRQQNSLIYMDEKLLTALGLSASEAGVYRAVLKAGRVEPAALAKAAGVKRTTAYSIARGLAEKGLLIEDATRRPRVFTPASPEAVLALIETDKKRLVEREASLKDLANELAKVSAEKSYPVPTVRFIEEGKLAEFLKQAAPVWDKSIIESKETTWWGFQDHTLVEHYGDWISWYWKQSPAEIDLKLLSNHAETEVKFGANADPRRAIKFWGEAANFLSTTWAIGDYLVMINTRTRPFYLVEIHDALMAHDQREVFKNLWPLV